MHAERPQPSVRARFGKWSGALLGTAAWFADQQIVSTSIYILCPTQQTRGLVVGVGAACALVAVIGAWLSWAARRELVDDPGDSLRIDRFIALISMLIAGISLLAIIFGTMAGVILQCER